MNRHGSPAEFHPLHDDTSLDFQLNRLATLGGGRLEEIREAAPRRYSRAASTTRSTSAPPIQDASGIKRNSRKRRRVVVSKGHSRTASMRAS